MRNKTANVNAVATKCSRSLVYCAIRYTRAKSEGVVLTCGFGYMRLHPVFLGTTAEVVHVPEQQVPEAPCGLALAEECLAKRLLYIGWFTLNFRNCLGVQSPHLF